MSVTLEDKVRDHVISARGDEILNDNCMRYDTNIREHMHIVDEYIDNMPNSELLEAMSIAMSD